MTVFGAPRALADKERAAVRAARAIAREVPTLEVTDSSGAPHRLHAGIGIATGAGYVGNVRAVDRSIWVALGNTTNLAARLQSMTRDHDASIALDEATWRGAGELARLFRSLGVLPIRGRRPIEVFTLALSEEA
jgi:adenylate cyclase